MQTIRLERNQNPLVVDLWPARNPSGAAPILLVHGWGGSGGYWAQTAQSLSEHVDVIVPDLPGTGRSMPVTGAQNLYEQVDSLVFLLDALEIGPVQVVGHSMGGAMAVLLADKRPEQVERLVLTSLCFFTSEAQKNVHRTVMKITYLTMFYRPTWLADVPALRRMMASRYFYRLPQDEELLRLGLLDFLTLDRETAIICGEDARDDNIPLAGSRLSMPVLLIACRQDGVMPVSNVEYTAHVIPDCQVHWIEECGHIPMVEKPQEYLALLNDFLELEAASMPLLVPA
jgi:pimeloyl-ACP methyl ester carboxylesterase